MAQTLAIAWGVIMFLAIPLAGWYTEKKKLEAEDEDGE